MQKQQQHECERLNNAANCFRHTNKPHSNTHRNWRTPIHLQSAMAAHKSEELGSIWPTLVCPACTAPPCTLAWLHLPHFTIHQCRNQLCAINFWRRITTAGRPQIAGAPAHDTIKLRGLLRKHHTTVVLCTVCLPTPCSAAFYNTVCSAIQARAESPSMKPSVKHGPPTSAESKAFRHT